MAVVISHMGYYTDNLSFIPNWVWNTPAVIFTDGPSAVSIFFVLSGLVLSYQYLRSNLGEFMLRTDLLPFLVNRTARICLPFVAVLGLSFLGYAVTKDHHFSEFVTIPDQLPWMRSRWGYELGILDVARQIFARTRWWKSTNTAGLVTNGRIQSVAIISIFHCCRHAKFGGTLAACTSTSEKSLVFHSFCIRHLDQ